jgi:hypothetical protein
MKKYSVEVTVTFTDYIEVEAESHEEAEALAEERVTESVGGVSHSYAYANELDDGEKIPRSWLDLPLPAAT